MHAIAVLHAIDVTRKASRTSFEVVELRTEYVFGNNNVFRRIHIPLLLIVALGRLVKYHS